MALEARGIDFSYGPLQVLFDLSMQVNEREILALLGTNGAGKTTVLRVLSGLEQPERGSVFLRGDDVTGLPAERRCGWGSAMFPPARVCSRR